MARNGPNGKASFQPRFPLIKIPAATKPPKINAPIIITKIPGQPNKTPNAPASFKSPSPMPRPLVIKTIKLKITKPIAAPSK